MKRGFTLLELIIVLIILGVLSTLGITQYGAMRERALGREAVAQLKMIQAAEEVLYLETNSRKTCNNTSDCKSKLKLDLSSNWVYSVHEWMSACQHCPSSYVPPSGFEAKATRGDCVYRLDLTWEKPIVQSGKTCRYTP